MNQELDKCRSELQQVTADFEEFAYIVSHDLKAPIRAIYNLSAWIEEDLGENVSEDVKENIRLLQNRSERMERMIQALLLFSRVNRVDLEITETDTGDLIQQAWKKADPDDRVMLSIIGSMPVITTYESKLYSVFEYLFQNAVKFNESSNPTVSVSVQDAGDLLKFEITDNGPGIPADALTKVFSIFYTVQPKDRFDTTGAGLALARKIVLFAGGAIHINSSPENGTTVIFSWPKKINSNN